MSFQGHLEGLLNKGKAKFKEFNEQRQQRQQQQQHHQYPQQPPHQFHSGGPPLIPYGTKPGGSHPAQPYWQPFFTPSTPVSALFQHETGAHGWGNNESQNYTAAAANSFFTPDGKLVVRAIVNHSLPENKFTSARLVSHQTLDRQRGCLTAVLSAPCAAGIWPAFWLLPKAPFSWPTDGEVDVFESWNGDCVNHSCLHWGHFNGEDSQKHRVVETPIPDMARRPVTMAFAWDQPENGQGGRMVWYIDGRTVMKANIPEGTRRMSEFNVILNVAMGGNVCQGRLPADGVYDFVVHELRMDHEPVGGWGIFAEEFQRGREGKTM
ncbi:uncharacterized protein L3040_007060 [Drepanopeziza brunnea f. sp. 'multigermtubi']|uniref:GH16 domain-containing protein n=1 Tax=Marssonina brunnea f. sp. multigermtubi (strain MB_m1) TaxID=1072389 RepID=K1WW22_MARBU|nr:uncharacterized protein MBM_09132 [Drepanopeziza brunnea f. sp. 'multigermtubi' MB_m1]EKD12903.1 hypothetical protein MBM_09132 [Drepanopeziza brunnea f. sp. 'multigermtubi' MB_m1]KAJ5038192.1 hypothetical protein L3040_007060 [Drepanopeziza brunnea f. sp. 'multigermtubi']